MEQQIALTLLSAALQPLMSKIFGGGSTTPQLPPEVVSPPKPDLTPFLLQQSLQAGVGGNQNLAFQMLLAMMQRGGFIG